MNALPVRANHHNATLGYNMLLHCTNFLHELGTVARHMEIYQLPQCYARAEYVLVLHKLSSRTGDGGSPYGNLPTTTMLRSGGICFGIAQTIFTNWGRWLAIWKFTNYHNVTLGRNMFWYCTNYLHELGLRLAIWKFTNYHNVTLGQNMF